MTLHGAKGLEFDAVFLPGWEEGLFPSQRTMDEHGTKGLEEERRLAYVGMTRARQRAYVSYVANRRMYGNFISAIPSRFVDELPPTLVNVSADKGLYKGRSQHWDSSGFSSGYKAAPSRSVARDIDYDQSADSFRRGDKVFHDKFGYGEVVHIDGHKLDIRFDTSGIKRVMDSFVQKN
jgi:DNA helicase-2/ATP-dependent DNA helicase PcrA